MYITYLEALHEPRIAALTESYTLVVTSEARTKSSLAFAQDFRRPELNGVTDKVIGIIEGWGTDSEEIIPLDIGRKERPRVNIIFLLY